MRHGVKIILASLLMVVTIFRTFGDTPADSVKVFFPVGYSRFNPALGDNGEAMDRFIDLVRIAKESGSLDSIVVRGYASPEGVSVANERLSLLRCQNVADLIIKRAEVNPGIVRTVPEGVAWKELRRLVAENPDVPSREKILYILDNVPLWIFDSKGVIVDGRKKQLMDLDRGNTFHWLQTHIFPQLRNAVAVALYTKPIAHRPKPAEEMWLMCDSAVTHKTDMYDKWEPSGQPEPSEVKPAVFPSEEDEVMP